MIRITAIAILVLGLQACTSTTENATPTALQEANPFPDCDYDAREPQPGQVVNMRIPMRDCVRLSTNVIFPSERKESYPVVLVRTPYGKGNDQDIPFLDISTLFRSSGFVTVIQDTRGRYDSEGLHVVIKDEPIDTVDTLAWLEMQPWFDGRLGVWGLSYLAISAIAASILRPDLVDAAVVGIMGADMYTLASDHGVVRADAIRFASATVTEGAREGIHDAESVIAAIQEFPLDEVDIRSGLGEVPFKEIFLGHLERDDFWNELLDVEAWQKTELPVYMLTGWYDFQWRNQVNDYNAIYKRRQGKDHFLHIGPWPHFLGFDDVHDYPFDNYRAGVEPMLDSVRFLQRYVLDADTFDTEKSVTYYDGGSGEWHEQDALWPAQTREWKLALDATTTDCPLALASAVTIEAEAEYVYDPDEVFELPGVLTLEEAAMVTETTWCGRSDALVFESEILDQPVEIAGSITADLTIKTTVEDTPFVARLSLVDTDGTVYNLREGVMLLSHRNSDSVLASYTPGDVVNVSVPLVPLRWTLQPGQRLRLGIASSAWPLTVPHTNVAGDWTAVSEPLVATQTVLTGPNRSVLRIDVSQ